MLIKKSVICGHHFSVPILAIETGSDIVKSAHVSKKVKSKKHKRKRKYKGHVTALYCNLIGGLYHNRLRSSFFVISLLQFLTIFN